MVMSYNILDKIDKTEKPLPAIEEVFIYTSIHLYASTTSFPKGKNASLTNLKCCRPKGIPIIVIQRTTPSTI